MSNFTQNESANSVFSNLGSNYSTPKSAKQAKSTNRGMPLYVAVILTLFVIFVVSGVWLFNSSKTTRPKVVVATGISHTVLLRPDGTVAATGEKEAWSGISKWEDVVALAAGDFHTLGLKSDGSVVAAGSNSNGECNVSRWEDIISIAAGRDHSVGLRKDGTVLACGGYATGECDVDDWSDIKAIAAGNMITVGIKEDGTVVYSGVNIGGRCEGLSFWADITDVSVSSNSVVGIKSDGSVIISGGQEDINVSSWNSITALAAGNYHVVGLRSDGTVVATGDNSKGQCRVFGWRDVIAIAAGGELTVGITSDGTVLAAGNNKDPQYDMRNLFSFHETIEQEEPLICEELFRWTDIVEIETYPFNPVPMYVGLKKDGSLAICGGPEEAVYQAVSWTGIKKVVSSGEHILALRDDGTVLAAGDNKYGECDVSSWENIVDISAGHCWSTGVTAEGEFLFAGYGEYNPKVWMAFGHLEQTDGWSELAKISSGWDSMAALRKDGKVSSFGFDKMSGDYYQQNDDPQADQVISISLARDNLAKLYSNGTVKVIGDNSFGQCDTSSWTGVIQVEEGDGHTVGLLSDGTVAAVGNNDCGQCEVDRWKDIVDIAAGRFCTIGVSRSGKIFYTGISA